MTWNRKYLREPLTKAEEYWKKLGPGLTTGAADDDPSGIATYSQAGAQTGFRMLWLTTWTFPLMAAIQEMCARLGLVTGKGLAANIRENYPRSILYFTTALLFLANTFNLGVDLGAMAQATQLIFPQFNFFWIVGMFAVISLLAEVFVPYQLYARYLKYLALILFTYVASALLANLNWSEIGWQALVPSFEWNRESILLISAILGTTISPYLFFWQTSQEVEESNGRYPDATTVGTTRPEIWNMRVDVWSGMFISNLVAFFIIAACGATLHAAGITSITTASEAAEALRPFAGNAAFTLFTLGLIGTGLLTIPILAGSASYAIAESLRWKEGLNLRVKQASGFYAVILLSIGIGFLINILKLDSMRALIWAAIGNAITAPFVLFFIVHLTSSPKIMGEHVNRPLTKLIGWMVTALMAVGGILTLYFLFF